MCEQCGDSGIKSMKVDRDDNITKIVYCECVKHYGKKEKPINRIIG